MPIDIDELRGKALALGTEIFDGPSEGAVEVLHSRVFPVPIPGSTKAAELVLCRVALAAAVVAKALGIPARDYWRSLKASVLDRVIQPALTTADDRAAWGALEGRLMDIAFGAEEEGQQNGR
jgi:hypothetical protein